MSDNSNPTFGTGGHPIVGALWGGVQDISQGKTYTFKRYMRIPLGYDGSVVWLEQDDEEITVQGSLHINGNIVLEENQTFDTNTVAFTTRDEIRPFHQSEDDCCYQYIGDYEGVPYLFSARGSTYDYQTKLYHYIGESIPPRLRNIYYGKDDDINDLKIVNNSLPFFMELFSSPRWINILNPFIFQFPFWPSYLIPNNTPSPYLSIHNEPSSIRSGSVGFLSPNTFSSGQFVFERVILTMYGFNHLQASNVREYVMRASELQGDFGVSNVPNIVDEKEPFPPGTTISQKKRIDFEVNFWQGAARESAARLIKSARVGFERIN